MSRYDDLGKVWDDRAFKAAASATDKPRRWLLYGTLAVVAVIAVIVFGGWWIGWWFKGQNVNRESHLFRNSYANQQTLREQITTNVGNVLGVSAQIAATSDAAEKAALRAQAKAIVAIVCQDADQASGDPLPPDQRQFVKTNCEAGTVSPSSPYSQGVSP